MSALFEHYRFNISPLSVADGGGFLITWPDLPGCMSDGETIEETIIHGRDAFLTYVATHKETGRNLPPPDGTACDVQQPEPNGALLTCSISDPSIVLLTQ